ncbi:MAG TPA: OmpA family protein [Bryobacteraceae bacterium]|nr:OmpA family protein [Bryobacteraceae bacterium]
MIGLTSGCRKKVAVAPPAPPSAQEVPPPAPKAPAASITAEPSTVEAGQAVTLKWSSTDATEAAISGIGSVAVEGRQQVRPENATTYELVAQGPGGSATASVTVNVMAPPPPIILPPAPVASKSLEDRIAWELSDVYFDYDRSDMREDAIAALAKDAEALQSILAEFPAAVIIVEGHCDERGSAEYNLGLGDRRADAARAYLEALVPADRLKTVSYGKERPQCTDAAEACWQKNRRVHFANGGPPTGTN